MAGERIPVCEYRSAQPAGDSRAGESAARMPRAPRRQAAVPGERQVRQFQRAAGVRAVAGQATAIASSRDVSVYLGLGFGEFGQDPAWVRDDHRACSVTVATRLS